MTFACPHCQARFAYEAEGSPTEVFCPRCGKAFDPAKGSTIRQAPTPAAEESDGRLAAGARLGQFRIDALIGRGGMGAVYRATQASLDRAVALKVLPARLAADAEFVQRFQRESKALAELSHPNIVAIHDRGFDEGRFWFAMELIDGVSLRSLIQAKRMPPDEALRIAVQLCEALEYAHARGVIHRDIKPENVLVDREGRVKVADFGLARIVGGERAVEGLTRSDVTMGTVDYMAPEQRGNARDVDHRADIYSLGVVFYEMLTGEVPIGRFDPPSKKAQVDPRVDEVVLRLLERSPETRFQRASEVKERIERIRAEPPPSQGILVPGKHGPQPLELVVRKVVATLAVAVGLAFLALAGPMAHDGQWYDGIFGWGGGGLLAIGAVLGWSLLIFPRREVPPDFVKTFLALLILPGFGGFIFGMISFTDPRSIPMDGEWTFRAWYLLITAVAFFCFLGASTELASREPLGRIVRAWATVLLLVVLFGGRAVIGLLDPLDGMRTAGALALLYPLACLGAWAAAKHLTAPE